jgi:GNAT superfamily N-acetyltransferase
MKQKAHRLLALKISPEAFGSTYEREKAFEFSEWKARLENPLAHTWVASEHSANDQNEDENEVLGREWLGSVVLFGPLDSSSAYNKTRNVCMIFDIYALFVLPSARGLGLGRRLMEAAIGHAKSLARERQAKELIIKISYRAENVKALKLYQTLGFALKSSVEDSFQGEKQDQNTQMLDMALKLDVTTGCIEGSRPYETFD